MRTYCFWLVSGALSVTAAGLEVRAAEAEKVANAASEAAVRKAVADYSRAAEEITQGGGARSVAGPFKPSPAQGGAVLNAAVSAKASVTTAATAGSGSPAANRAMERAPRSTPYAQQANEARARGDVAGALATWMEAERAAQRSGDRESVAQAALNQARLLMTLPTTNDAAQQQRGVALVASYRTAIEALPRPEQAFARNNLAVVYLQRGDPAAAAAVMREVDWKAVDPEQLALCRYNFGRAEEGSGNFEAAIRQYRMALTQEPNFAPNVEALFRVLTQRRDAGQLAEAGNELVRRGEAVATVPRLRDALAALANETDAPAVLTALVAALAAAPVSPGEFAREQAEMLTALAEKTPALAAMIAQLKRAYAGELPLEFSGGETRAALAAWSGAPRNAAMSKLLQALGDFHLRPPVVARGARERSAGISRESARRALVSYAAAWMIDRANTDGPVYAAAVLQEHRALDASGALLGSLIDQLFQQKGATIGIPVKSPEDLRNLMRLHLVLATIFEREKIWGPRWTARSASFQFAHAIALEQELRAVDATFAASPDLYARAARAYEEAKEPGLALEFYTKAAEAYLFFRDAPLARQTRDAALKLSGGREASYQARLAEVGTRLDRM